MSSYFVSAQRIIAAPRQQLFDIVATAARHPEFDGSGTVQGEIASSSQRLELGAQFGMRMKKGVKYRMTNTVVEFAEGKTIAWKPLGNYTWRYTFEDVAEGTLVTEQWDARQFKMRFALKLLGIPAATQRAIAATLERLALIAERER